MKKYLACGFLCSAIMLISFGIHIDNTIVICIGGGFAGAYNTIIFKQN